MQQQRSLQVPTPPPETAALGYFAGSWRMEGEDGKSPFGPGGKITGEDTCAKEGRAWRWVTIPARMPEGMISVRYVVTEVSDREYTCEWDYARGKAAWQPGGKGRATRQ